MGTRLLILWVLATSAEAPALDLLVNQVGYETNGPKTVRVQRASDFGGDGMFSVCRSADGTQVFAGVLTRRGGLWDKWYWQGDFTSLRIQDNYRITATVGDETNSSYCFTVGDGTLQSQTGTLAYLYFWTQRCGVDVPGWHGTCHADDGLRKDNLQHIDAAGGWHDAGDYNKFPQGFAADGLFDLLWLYDSNRGYYDAIDTDANGIADIVDEALHQARWLVKMVDANGHCFQGTQIRRTGSTFVRPEADTDNVVGTSDDRWINPGDENTPQETVCCAALVKMHRILASRGLPTENFRDKALAIWNHRVALAIAQGGHNNLGNGAMQIFAGLDLYAELGLQDCYDRAMQCVDGMAQAASSNPAIYDSIDAAETAGYELGVMAWFARTYPTAYPANTARAAVQALMTHNIDLANDPIGLIRRDEGGTLQYFPTNSNWNGFFLGINRLYLLLTWGAAEAYKTVGDPAYLRFAVDQYNWVMGANYNSLCMMDGTGTYNPPTYHTRYYKIPGHETGKQPGVVPNGYVRTYDTGMPNMDLSGNRPARYQTNEGWLINNAAYAMALSAMTVFADAAQYVSDTIPTTMEAGRQYTVTVQMRNTSFMSWDHDNYQLGAVDDSDPFAAPRQPLGDGVTVSPGQSYTWTFLMTVPSALGTYVTDWRMVQANGHWFGDTLSRQVRVVPPDTTPPTMATSVNPAASTATTPSITITAQDGGTGLNVGTAQYAYSLDGGATWSPWVENCCLHSRGTASGTCGGGNCYWYPDVCKSSYTVASGDVFQYDIYYPSSSQHNGGMDLEFDTGDLRDKQPPVYDQNGRHNHPGTDLSSVAYQRWYHREISLNAFVGRILHSIEMAHEVDSGASEYYVRNVRIVNATAIKINAYQNQSTFLWPTEQYGPANNGYSSTLQDTVLDPATRVSCTGSNGTTAVQTITAHGVPFYRADCTNNRIKFRISDMAGNVGISGAFTVVIEGSAPIAPDSASATPDNVCAGDAGSLLLTANGGSGAALKWYSGACGGTYVGAGTTLQIPAPAQTTIYYARWETVCGTPSGCASATVAVNSPPAIVQQPLPPAFTACDGEPLALWCVASGSEVHYQWQKDLSNIDGATSSSYTTTRAGSYRCIASNACGSTTSNSATRTHIVCVPADFDRDGDVDLNDFGFFQRCFSGPNRPPALPACGPADLDFDNDVDLADFLTFQSCFNGPDRPPACP